MKKLIGILGVAVLAATMFFSANNVAGSNSDASLASLVGMNSANAEELPGGPVWYRFGSYVPVTYGGTEYSVQVDVIVNGVKVGVKTVWRTTQSYTIYDCKGWVGNC